MIIDKNGKVLANAVKPTVVFTSQNEYNTWKASLNQGVTEADFVVIKQFSSSANAAVHRGTGTNPQSVFNNPVVGDIYVISQYSNPRLYTYTNDGFKEFQYT